MAYAWTYKERNIFYNRSISFIKNNYIKKTFKDWNNTLIFNNKKNKFITSFYLLIQTKYI